MTDSNAIASWPHLIAAAATLRLSGRLLDIAKRNRRRCSVALAAPSQAVFDS
jgi:hypothetical protein